MLALSQWTGIIEFHCSWIKRNHNMHMYFYGDTHAYPGIYTGKGYNILEIFNLLLQNTENKL